MRKPLRGLLMAPGNSVRVTVTVLLETEVGREVGREVGGEAG